MSPSEGVPTHLERLLMNFTDLVNALLPLDGHYVRDLQGIFAWIDDHNPEEAHEQLDSLRA